jgi:hypothetical protein
LDKAIDGLEDEGGAPTVFGRHITLNTPLRNFAGFSDSVNDDMTRRGKIGVYHGANLVTLIDPWARRDATHLIRKDRVYVASGTPGAIFMDKPVTFLNWSLVDARTASFGVGIRIEDGLLVFDPYQYRIIEIV